MTLSTYLTAESSSVEFKETLDSPKPVTWLKTVSAFANTKGGVILVGIRDSDKAKIGVENINATIEKARTLINSRIEPPVPYEIDTLIEDDKQFLIIRVEKGDYPPYYYSHEDRKSAYIRKGDESSKAPIHLLNELILQGQHKRYDELESPYSIDDVSFSELTATYRYETGKAFNAERDLKSFGLVSQSNRVTYAGLLLCDQNYLVHSRIFCTRWKGLIKGSVNLHTIDDKEFTGNIIHLLKEAENFVRRNSRTMWKISGRRREEIQEYPEAAVREALVNAIIHRDYFMNGSEIHVDMFDDRMEITSPGGMRDGRLIQNLDITHISSNRRNPVIADVFSRLGYAERRGSGLSRIRESFSHPDMVQFISDDAVFMVIMKGTVNKEDTAYLGENRAHLGEDTAHLEGDKAHLKEDTAYLEGDTAHLEEELYLFTLHAKESLGDGFYTKSYDSLCRLFHASGYTKPFGRDEVMTAFAVKERRTGYILKKLMDSGVIVREKRNQYYFVRRQ